MPGVVRLALPWVPAALPAHEIKAPFIGQLLLCVGFRAVPIPYVPSLNAGEASRGTGFQGPDSSCVPGTVLSSQGGSSQRHYISTYYVHFPGKVPE